MYIGIDLGTSGVKVILMSEDGSVIDNESSPLTVSRPQTLWSEQGPESWWTSTNKAMQALAAKHNLKTVKAIGLSGQMHGATLLDDNNKILRPAILWNDGRSSKACMQLEQKCPEIQSITGNLVMPGFTAPKILWTKECEPHVYDQVHKVLLPKDYLRFRMTGEFATDMSDASGTLWLDTQKRAWSEKVLQATGLELEHMPTLFEGPDVTGVLTKEVADSWSLNCIPVMAGGGDNAAGAIGMGIIDNEQTMLSLGTSGVIFSVNKSFAANPNVALHSFAHAIPNTWHSMSVILSAASCLDWVVRLTGFNSVETALKVVQNTERKISSVVFLPYLSGERTPHNDPNAKGVFWGMTHETTQVDLINAVLEGVSFALLDGLEAVQSIQKTAKPIDVIGGGAKSTYWLQMIADIFSLPLNYREGGTMGPALGAARLAAIGNQNKSVLSDICFQPDIKQSYQPNDRRSKEYTEKRAIFKTLFHKIQNI